VYELQLQLQFILNYLFNNSLDTLYIFWLPLNVHPFLLH